MLKRRSNDAQMMLKQRSNDAQTTLATSLFNVMLNGCNNMNCAMLQYFQTVQIDFNVFAAHFLLQGRNVLQVFLFVIQFVSRSLEHFGMLSGAVAAETAEEKRNEKREGRFGACLQQATYTTGFQTNSIMLQMLHTYT